MGRSIKQMGNGRISKPQILVLVNDSNKKHIQYCFDEFPAKLTFAYSSAEVTTLIKNCQYDLIFFYIYKWESRFTDYKSAKAILSTVRSLRLDGYKDGLILVSPSIHSFQSLLKLYPLSKVVDSLCDSARVSANLQDLFIHSTLRSQDRKNDRALRDAVFLVRKSMEEMIAEAVLSENDFLGFQVIPKVRPILDQYADEIKNNSKLLKLKLDST